MKHKTLYKVILLFLFAVACTEKDLEIKPAGDVQNYYYKTEDQIVAAIVAAYDPLQWVGYGEGQGFWGNSPFTWGNVTSDDVVAGGNDPTDQIGYQNAAAHIVNADDVGNNLFANYRCYFKGIYRANLVIHYGSDPEFANSTVVKQAVAEAKFLKALYYFYLTRMFGDLPIIQDIPEIGQEYDRAPQADVLNYCVDLLKEAISGGIQKRTSQKDPENGRATLGSAQALLGKIYVYQKNYTDAIKVLKEIESSGNYDLEDDFDKVFDADNEHGKESLFEINFILNGPDQTSCQANPEIQESNFEIRLYGPRTGVVDINGEINWGWGYCQPTQNLVEQYTAEDTIRSHRTFISTDSLQKLGPTFVPQNEITGYWNMKYAALDKNTDTQVNHFKNNYCILRYADVLLLLAEAYSQSGDDANALKYLNMIRSRAKVTLRTGLTGEALFTAIKLERRLEMALEGERYFDLVRWGDAAAALGAYWTDGLPGEKSKGLFPIPLIELNTHQGKWQQNAGY